MASLVRDLRWCRQVLLPAFRVIWAERPDRARRVLPRREVPAFRATGAGVPEASRAPSRPVEWDAASDPTPV